MTEQPEVANEQESTFTTEGDERPSQGVSDLLALMRQEESLTRAKYRDYVKREDYARDLESAFRDFKVEGAPLRPGELVQWKTFMRNRAYPEYQAPAVVVAIDAESANHARLEVDAEDVVIGYLDADQDFCLVRTDARRLMRWED